MSSSRAKVLLDQVVTQAVTMRSRVVADTRSNPASHSPTASRRSGMPVVIL